MGFFDNLMNGGQGGNAAYTVPMPFLPQNLRQMQQMPYSALANEFEVTALCIATLCNYCQNPQA